MFSFSTHTVAQHERLNSWQHAVAEVFTPLDIRPRQHRDFLASVQCHRAGRLALARIEADPTTVTQREVASRSNHASPQYFLHMVLQGHLQVSQHHQCSLLGPGDMALCDASQPYTLENRQPCALLVMLIDGHDLAQHLLDPARLIGLHLPGHDGLCATVSAMLPHLYQHVSHSLDQAVGSRLHDGFLDILSAACTALVGAHAPETTLGHMRRLQIKRHIETHLRDSRLNPRTIAATFNISTRYLNLLFAVEKETLGHYILRRRLEQCARQLRDPQWKRRTITEIAFSWGFNNAAHFTHAFTARYAMCPRRYRGLHVGPDLGRMKGCAHRAPTIDG